MRDPTEFSFWGANGTMTKFLLNFPQPVVASDTKFRNREILVQNV